MNYNHNTKWCPTKYKTAIQKAVQLGELGCEKVTSQEEVYLVLSEKIGYHQDTLRKWGSNSGPQNPLIITALEDLLGASLRADVNEDVHYSDTVKNSIVESLYLMRNYLRSESPENPNNFYELILNLEVHEPMLPPNLYCKLQDFTYQTLAPISYNYKEVFKDTFSEADGTWEDENTFHIYETEDDRHLQNVIYNYCKVLVGIEKQLDAFAMKEFNLILTS